MSRDESTARRRNQKAAAEAPLLAWAGLVPVVTAEDVASRREKGKAAAEAHMAQQEAWEADRVAAMQAELQALCTPEAIAEWETASKVGQYGYVPLYIGLSSALDRARTGRPLFDPLPAAYHDMERRPVAVDTVVATLDAMGGRTSVSALCDRIGCTGVLDAAAALCRARDQGLVQVAAGGRGWELVR